MSDTGNVPLDELFGSVTDMPEREQCMLCTAKDKRIAELERERDEALARIVELETANDEIKQQWAWDVDALRADVERLMNGGS